MKRLKRKGRRHRLRDCPVCNATREQIRRAVEQSIEVPDPFDKNTPAPSAVIEGGVIVAERVIAKLQEKHA